MKPTTALATLFAIEPFASLPPAGTLATVYVDTAAVHVKDIHNKKSPWPIDALKREGIIQLFEWVMVDNLMLDVSVQGREFALTVIEDTVVGDIGSRGKLYCVSQRHRLTLKDSQEFAPTIVLP